MKSKIALILATTIIAACGRNESYRSGLIPSGTPNVAAPADATESGGDSSPAPVVNRCKVSPSSTTLTTNPRIPMGEAGVVVVDNNVQTISFARTYTNPVIILSPIGEGSNDPAMARVVDVNLTNQTFSVQAVKTSNFIALAGAQLAVPEHLGYFIYEEGAWLMESGHKFEAFILPENDMTIGPDVYDYGVHSRDVTSSFIAPQNAAIFATVQQMISCGTQAAAAKITRISGVNSSSQPKTAFDVAIEVETGTSNKCLGVTGYLAMESHVGQWMGKTFEAGRLTGLKRDATVEHKLYSYQGLYQSIPDVILAATHTRNEQEPTYLRMGTREWGHRWQGTFELKIQERRSEFPLVDEHAEEDFSYLVFDGINNSGQATSGTKILEACRQ